ncbi:c-type cytochrome, partial [Flexithrix dorotheae]|uniref:c-type cytochrome n=1 Tax=Flexithrix dorotheae TaxID=70993 RepID=UPI0004757BAF
KTDLQEIINSKTEKGNLAKIWNFCSEFTPEENRPQNDKSWEDFLNEGEGDPVKGQFVFQQQRNQCQTCHKVNGWGGDFGPDLSHIGSSKTKEQLIRAILEPSAEIAPEWQGWFVKSADGKMHYGRQIDVGFKNVELMGSDGEFVTYKEPLDYGITPSSLMPEGLENNLTARELKNLIAYLTELK